MKGTSVSRNLANLADHLDKLAKGEVEPEPELDLPPEDLGGEAPEGAEKIHEDIEKEIAKIEKAVLKIREKIEKSEGKPEEKSEEPDLEEKPKKGPKSKKEPKVSEFVDELNKISAEVDKFLRRDSK